MPKTAITPSRNHLRAWREYRRLTQEQLAEKVATTGGVISSIESGDRGLSHKWLMKLAPALGTTPGFLLDHDPNNLPKDVLEVWDRIPEADKDRALQMLKVFQRTGTEG